MKVNIDDKNIELEEPITVLKAARQLGITIPTLCYNDYLKPYGGCRLCLVEVDQPQAGTAKMVPACTTQAADGMVVHTQTERVQNARRFIIEMLLSRAPESEELQNIARWLGVSLDNRDDLDLVGDYLLHRAPRRKDTKCILCGQCVRVCIEVTERHALSYYKRGFQRTVQPPFDKVAERCIGCGSCLYVCPTKTVTVEEAE